MRPPAPLIAALLVLLGAACGGESAPIPTPPPVDTTHLDTTALTLPGEWVTLLERRMATRSTRPERFRATSPRLRVITEMGPNTTVHNVGFVVTNILSDDTSLPVASVRAEQFRLDATAVDTTEVEVPSAGTLYFFVAEHRRLPGWSVTIQEFRAAR